MTSRLQEILDTVRVRLEERTLRVPRRELEARARDQAAPRDFAASLRRPADESSPGMPARDAASPGSHPGLRVIGELKRRSPSAGSIHESLDPVAAARGLAHAGCVALSVLTEPDYFGGTLETLEQVRAVVALPLLRKDFILDPYQVVEARAYGADAILLLAAAHSDDALSRLHDTARQWDLHVLAEAHGARELERLLALDFPVVGLNARDLHTFEVDLGRALAWAESVPAGRVTVAESGVRTRADAQRVARAGVDAVLVGEGLMRGGDPTGRFRELFGGAENVSDDGEGEGPR